MRFETTILQTGNNTGIVVPAEVVDVLGKRAEVVVTVGGHTLRA